MKLACLISSARMLYELMLVYLVFYTCSLNPDPDELAVCFVS